MAMTCSLRLALRPPCAATIFPRTEELCNRLQVQTPKGFRSPGDAIVCWLYPPIITEVRAFYKDKAPPLRDWVCPAMASRLDEDMVRALRGLALRGRTHSRAQLTGEAR